jgi:hypothetical protein
MAHSDQWDARSTNVSSTVFSFFIIHALSSDVNSLIHKQQQSTGASRLFFNKMTSAASASLAISSSINQNSNISLVNGQSVVFIF